MGTVGSSFPGDDGTILADIIKPADDGWVGKHAEECKSECQLKVGCHPGVAKGKISGILQIEYQTKLSSQILCCILIM